MPRLRPKYTCEDNIKMEFTVIGYESEFSWLRTGAADGISSYSVLSLTRPAHPDQTAVVQYSDLLVTTKYNCFQRAWSAQETTIFMIPSS